MSLAPGTRLGPYDVLGPIGAGGMGEVFKARDTRLGRDVAIKGMPASMAGDPERVARFQREAQVLATLNHPHIGAIYGLEEVGSTRYLVLEFIDGEPLADRLRRGALPLDEAITVAKEIIDALEAAHDKNIIHRDLKPANVMITAEGRVKVLDFGLARIVESDPAASTANSPTLTFAATQMGVILGTAAYMSPEQAKGRVADRRSDVWAFGCVVFEMLSGKRAFDGEDISETLAAVLRADPDWAALPAGVPAGVRTLLQRCLTRDRKARIPEMGTVRFLLDEVLAAPVASSAPIAPRTAGRERLWMALANHSWPAFLPDGRRFVYLSRNRDTTKSAIYLTSLDSTERTFLLHAHSIVEVVPGYLLYNDAGTLMAHPFDEREGRLTGAPFPLAEGLQYNSSNGRAAFAAGAAGLAYRTGSAFSQSMVLTWFDRQGRAVGTIGQPWAYRRPRVSNDGTRMAVSVRTNATSFDGDLFIIDLARGISSRFTSGPLSESDPLWTPGDASVVFADQNSGTANLFHQACGWRGPWSSAV